MVFDSGFTVEEIPQGADLPCKEQSVNEIGVMEGIEAPSLKRKKSLKNKGNVTDSERKKRSKHSKEGKKSKENDEGEKIVSE